MTVPGAGWSIERRLMVVMSGLLVGVILALSAASFVEVRETARTTAATRLVSLTSQLRDLFAQSATQLRATAAASAAKAAEQKRLTPDVIRYTGPNREQVVAMEVRDSAGALLVATETGHGVDTMSVRDVIAAAGTSADSVRIGQFRRIRDTLVYPIAARIPGRQAYLVQWRRLMRSKRAREQMSQLVGSDASIFVGEARGPGWTDLERLVPPPPVKTGSTPTIQSYERDGSGYMAAAATIAGTPWAIVVDFPKARITAPVYAFMRHMALIGLVALAIGVAAAFSLRRRIASMTLVRAMLEQRVAERTRELEQAQEALVRRERLALLGQLSSGVGHELRNPLGVMTNAVYYLKMMLAGQPQNIHEYLDIIQQQVTLSEKIVSDLLDFARQKPPQRKPTSIAEVMAEQVNRLGSTNGVKIQNEVPSNLAPVLVDRVQMGQIVFNLLTNAMQAMEGGGAIALRARENGQRVYCEVVDTGPGIAPDHLEKIFEPLFTTKARGIGLGLAVSRTLARANGGDLTVESRPGQGATFRLALEKGAVA